MRGRDTERLLEVINYVVCNHKSMRSNKNNLVIDIMYKSLDFPAAWVLSKYLEDNNHTLQLFGITYDEYTLRYQGTYLFYFWIFYV